VSKRRPMRIQVVGATLIAEIVTRYEKWPIRLHSYGHLSLSEARRLRDWLTRAIEWMQEQERQ
jgi:hypothetical protein